MTCSNAIIASLSEQDCVAVSAHIRMRRLLAAVDVMHGKFTPHKLETIAKQNAAMFIHEEKTGDVRIQLDGMELFVSSTGVATLRWLTVVQDST